MHGSSNENQRNNIIDRPHLGKTTFFFPFLFFWGGGEGVRGRGVMKCDMDLFKFRKMLFSSIYED